MQEEPEYPNGSESLRVFPWKWERGQFYSNCVTVTTHGRWAITVNVLIARLVN